MLCVFGAGMMLCGLFAEILVFCLDRCHFARVPVKEASVAAISSPGAGRRGFAKLPLHTLVATVVAVSSHNLVYRDVVMGMQ